MFTDPSKVVVGERFRGVDQALVDELMQSISEVGQLQPVLVTNDMTLVDGLHRLEACRRLGREVWVETEETAKLLLESPVQRRRAELQANLKRKNFEPLELAKAIAELDALMKATYGDASKGGRFAGTEGWSYDDTARILGFKDKATISRAVAVATAADSLPQLKTAKTMREAVKMVKEAARLEATQELLRRRAERPRSINPTDHLFLKDCRQGLRELQSGICNLFVTDPPFGVELDRAVVDRREVKGRLLGAWSDKPDEIFELLTDVIRQMARVGKPDCQVFMFCGTPHFWNLKSTFEANGFNVLNRPYIWVKARKEPFALTGGGRTQDPWHRPGHWYEVALYAWRGQARFAKPGHADVLVYPRLLDSIHPSQKPIELLMEVISNLVDPASNPLLIDPFAGTASTLIAAKRLGLKQFLGFEIDERWYNIGLGLLAAEGGDE
ncbi:MAG: DNA methyltransferase [Dehalococcoidia bacterium]|nr:DNA methyltransferase [Dehalococcoidia bacterium]